MEALIITAAVLLAGAYLVRRTVQKTRAAKKGGPCCGCGCAKKVGQKVP